MLYMDLVQVRDIDANVAEVNNIYFCNILNINKLPPPHTQKQI